MLKVPQIFTKAPYAQPVLKMDGVAVVESCMVTPRTGTMFLQNHLLLVVLRGQYTVHFAGETHQVRENEMILLQKAIAVQYRKVHADTEDDGLLDYMMFFLQDEVVAEFLSMANPISHETAMVKPVVIHPVSSRLASYLQSIRPYFCETQQADAQLLKLKLLELLFDITAANRQFYAQLAQLKQPDRAQLADIVEQNLYHPISLSDLAYLSGRSLASFKRDFQELYGESPGRWIRQRRLEKAQQLLKPGHLSVTEICLQTGFQNVSHFSKVFKEQFGVAPTAYRLSQIAK